MVRNTVRSHHQSPVSGFCGLGGNVSVDVSNEWALLADNYAVSTKLARPECSAQGNRI